MMKKQKIMKKKTAEPETFNVNSDLEPPVEGVDGSSDNDKGPARDRDSNKISMSFSPYQNKNSPPSIHSSHRMGRRDTTSRFQSRNQLKKGWSIS